MSVTAEMTTDKELDKLAHDTIVEMGEVPPDLPGEQLVTEDDAEDSPLSWLPRGNWRWRGSAPAELGSDTDGRVILTLSAVTSRPPAHEELGRIADDIDSKARSEALSRLQSTEEWRTYLEASAEHTDVRNRLDALDKEGRDLDAEHQRLAASPKGKGKRLAEIQKRQQDIGSAKHTFGLELQALQSVLTDARRKAQEQARELALEVIQSVRAEQQEALNNALANFFKKHGDELSNIVARLKARSSQSHDSWVGSLRSFVLSRLENASPLTEEASTV